MDKIDEVGSLRPISDEEAAEIQEKILSDPELRDRFEHPERYRARVWQRRTAAAS